MTGKGKGRNHSNKTAGTSSTALSGARRFASLALASRPTPHLRELLRRQRDQLNRSLDKDSEDDRSKNGEPATSWADCSPLSVLSGIDGFPDGPQTYLLPNHRLANTSKDELPAPSSTSIGVQPKKGRRAPLRDKALLSMGATAGDLLRAMFQPNMAELSALPSGMCSTAVALSAEKLCLNEAIASGLEGMGLEVPALPLHDLDHPPCASSSADCLLFIQDKLAVNIRNELCEIEETTIEKSFFEPDVIATSPAWSTAAATMASVQRSSGFIPDIINLKKLECQAATTALPLEEHSAEFDWGDSLSESGQHCQKIHLDGPADCQSVWHLGQRGQLLSIQCDCRTLPSMPQLFLLQGDSTSCEIFGSTDLGCVDLPQKTKDWPTVTTLYWDSHAARQHRSPSAISLDVLEAAAGIAVPSDTDLVEPPLVSPLSQPWPQTDLGAAVKNTLINMLSDLPRHEISQSPGQCSVPLADTLEGLLAADLRQERLEDDLLPLPYPPVDPQTAIESVARDQVDLASCVDPQQRPARSHLDIYLDWQLLQSAAQPSGRSGVNPCHNLLIAAGFQDPAFVTEIGALDSIRTTASGILSTTGPLCGQRHVQKGSMDKESMLPMLQCAISIKPVPHRPPCGGEPSCTTASPRPKLRQQGLLATTVQGRPQSVPAAAQDIDQAAVAQTDMSFFLRVCAPGLSSLPMDEKGATAPVTQHGDDSFQSTGCAEDRNHTELKQTLPAGSSNDKDLRFMQRPEAVSAPAQASLLVNGRSGVNSWSVVAVPVVVTTAQESYIRAKRQRYEGVLRAVEGKGAGVLVERPLRHGEDAVLTSTRALCVWEAAGPGDLATLSRERLPNLALAYLSVICIIEGSQFPAEEQAAAYHVAASLDLKLLLLFSPPPQANSESVSSTMTSLIQSLESYIASSVAPSHGLPPEMESAAEKYLCGFGCLNPLAAIALLHMYSPDGGECVDLQELTHRLLQAFSDCSDDTLAAIGGDHIPTRSLRLLASRLRDPTAQLEPSHAAGQSRESRPADTSGDCPTVRRLHSDIAAKAMARVGARILPGTRAPAVEQPELYQPSHQHRGHTGRQQACQQSVNQNSEVGPGYPVPWSQARQIGCEMSAGQRMDVDQMRGIPAFSSPNARNACPSGSYDSSVLSEPRTWRKSHQSPDENDLLGIRLHPQRGANELNLHREDVQPNLWGITSPSNSVAHLQQAGGSMYEQGCLPPEADAMEEDCWDWGLGIPPDGPADEPCLSHHINLSDNDQGQANGHGHTHSHEQRPMHPGCFRFQQPKEQHNISTAHLRGRPAVVDPISHCHQDVLCTPPPSSAVCPPHAGCDEFGVGLITHDLDFMAREEQWDEPAGSLGNHQQNVPKQADVHRNSSLGRSHPPRQHRTNPSARMAFGIGSSLIQKAPGYTSSKVASSLSKSKRDRPGKMNLGDLMRGKKAARKVGRQHSRR